MFSGDGIGHGKLSAVIILHEGIEAACVHFRLQNHPAVREIVRSHLQNTDMLPVNGCVEQVQSAAVEDKIPSRLAVLHFHRLFPGTVGQAIRCQGILLEQVLVLLNL